MYCDLCRVNVPIEENFQKVIIGDSTVAEVCITCGTQLASGIKTQVMAASKKIADAQEAVQAPPAATAPPVDPGDPQAKTPEELNSGSRQGPAK